MTTFHSFLFSCEHNLFAIEQMESSNPFEIPGDGIGTLFAGKIREYGMRFKLKIVNSKS
jgi:hypothetical protein